MYENGEPLFVQVCDKAIGIEWQYRYSTCTRVPLLVRISPCTYEYLHRVTVPVLLPYSVQVLHANETSAYSISQYLLRNLPFIRTCTRTVPIPVLVLVPQCDIVMLFLSTGIQSLAATV